MPICSERSWRDACASTPPDRSHVSAGAVIPKHFSTVTLDTFVVMPDHMHGIIVIGKSPGERNVGAQHAAPLPLRTRLSATSQDSAPASGSLGAIVRSFKSAATKRINELRHSPGEPVWQRNYFDRVIRSDDELYRARRYILTNPDRWSNSADS